MGIGFDLRSQFRQWTRLDNTWFPQVYILPYPFTFLLKGNGPLKSPDSGAEGDNAEGLNNYAFLFSSFSTTLKTLTA